LQFPKPFCLKASLVQLLHIKANLLSTKSVDNPVYRIKNSLYEQPFF